jgi:hypothetical protein
MKTAPVEDKIKRSALNLARKEVKKPEIAFYIGLVRLFTRFFQSYVGGVNGNHLEAILG